VAALLLLACTVLTLTALAAAGVALTRFHRRGIAPAAVSLAGGLLAWAWPIAVIGLAEGVYTGWPGLATVLALAGTAGFAAVVAGVVMALRRNPLQGPGRCRACGYDLAGHRPPARCPECGEPAA